MEEKPKPHKVIDLKKVIQIINGWDENSVPLCLCSKNIYIFFPNHKSCQNPNRINILFEHLVIP